MQRVTRQDTWNGEKACDKTYDDGRSFGASA